MTSRRTIGEVPQAHWTTSQLTRPSSNLFVYGTLMCDEIVQALLGRSLPTCDATLPDFTRVKLDRPDHPEGAAKGPAIFPQAGSEVVGQLIYNLDEDAAAVIERFETAAGGYKTALVEVTTSDGQRVAATTYVGEDDMRPLANGDWDLQTFKSEYLDHYVNIRIPNLIMTWPTATAAQTLMSIEEKQVLLLRRNWEIIEVFKSLRMRVPVLFSGTILLLFSFASQATHIPAILAMLFIAVIMTTGLIALKWVHSQYAYVHDKINYLYGQLDMLGPEFWDHDPASVRDADDKEMAKSMFIAGYVSIALISLVSIVGLLS